MYRRMAKYNALPPISWTMDLDHIIAKYKFMVKDECRIKTKSKDIRVRSSSSPMNS